MFLIVGQLASAIGLVLYRPGKGSLLLNTAIWILGGERQISPGIHRAITLQNLKMACTFQSAGAPRAPEEVLAALCWLPDRDRFIQKLFSVIKFACLKGLIPNTWTLRLQCGRMEVASAHTG